MTHRTVPDTTRPWAVYALTPKQYENLSRNMAELHRWVREAKFRLDYYAAPDTVR